MNNKKIPTNAEQGDARQVWEQPTVAKFRAGDAETTGGFTNETGFS